MHAYGHCFGSIANNLQAKLHGGREMNAKVLQCISSPSRTQNNIDLFSLGPH